MILNKIEQKKNQKLDRSYALVEFSNDKIKNDSILADLRLFGFKIGSIHCNIEDADLKTTIMVYNIVWGTELG